MKPNIVLVVGPAEDLPKANLPEALALREKIYITDTDRPPVKLPSFDAPVDNLPFYLKLPKFRRRK